MRSLRGERRKNRGKVDFFPKILFDPLREFWEHQAMQTKIVLPLLLLVATSATAQVQNIWMVGRNDNLWQTANTGGGADANFAQENGAINPLPGSPNSTGAAQGADNDYYFGGIYSIAIPSVTTRYGAYSPIGVVSANENAIERAFAAADNDLRVHFNLPASLGSDDLLTISYDALNLDLDNGTPTTADDPTDPRYGIELYFNGVLVEPQNIIRPPQIGTTFTSAQFSLSSVNAQTGPGFDNVVSLVGINYSGASGGNWMGIDYIQLDATPVPEPTSTALVALFGGIGFMVFLLRRRR